MYAHIILELNELYEIYSIDLINKAKAGNVEGVKTQASYLKVIDELQKRFREKERKHDQEDQ